MSKILNYKYSVKIPKENHIEALEWCKNELRFYKFYHKPVSEYSKELEDAIGYFALGNEEKAKKILTDYYVDMVRDIANEMKTGIPMDGKLSAFYFKAEADALLFKLSWC